MSYTAGYNFDVSNLDSSFYKKYSAGTPIPDPYKSIIVGGDADANTQIQDALNELNDFFIDDSVRIVLKFGGISASTGDAGASPTYHRFSAPVLIDHPVSDRLLIEGVPPSDHSILGVSYYDAVGYTGIGISEDKYTGLTAADAGYYAQFVISNGNSLRIGEYLAVYDNRYQKYLNPSFYQFRDTVNGRVFATPYPVTAEKLRASLIVGVHKIVDKIDLDESRVAGITINPINKVDYVTVHIKGYNPTYSIGLGDYGSTFARRALLTPQGIVGRYEQGYGASTVLEDVLFFSGLSSGDTGASAPGYRASEDFRYGATGSPNFSTGFGAIPKNRQGLTGYYMGGSPQPVGANWEKYDRLSQTTGHNLSVRNFRDSNDFRAKGFKSIIECENDGFIITNNSKPPEIKNILLLSTGGATGTHGIRVDNSSSVNLHQVAVVGFERGAGVFANNKSTVNCISDKFSDPEVFREVGVFSSGNYTGYEARNGSNINAPRSVGAGSIFANYYASENSYINAYASTSTSSRRYGVAAVGKSFVNADSAFSCFNGSDGFFCSNGSLLTINSGRACYNYGNGIHAFSSGEIRSFDVIVSSNKKDGIVANDMSTIVCGDSSKEPINWDLYYGYDDRYYNFENPTNISQSIYNGISGLASSTDSFINASFFETYDNSRLGGEFGRLKDVGCVQSNTVGYCFGGGSAAKAGLTCDAGYRYCDDAVYDTTFDGGNTNGVLNDLTPKATPVSSLCIPYASSTGVTAQIPVSKARYTSIINGLSAEYGGNSGLTIGKILACKGYLPGCAIRFSSSSSGDLSTGDSNGISICGPGNDPDQILAGATGTASESFIINSNILACTADTESLALNVVCVSQPTAYRTPARPLSLLLPNYDVEIRDSSKIAFAGRISNFGYYDIRTGARIQPLYQGSSETDLLLKPSTLIGYAGNRNGSELVITDQTALQPGGIFGSQAVNSLDPRYSKYTVRYSSEDFLLAADLYDPVPQVGFVNQTPYVLNLGNRDPETGALLSSIGTTAGQIAVTNTSSTPPLSMGTNDQSSGLGNPTY